MRTLENLITTCRKASRLIDDNPDIRTMVQLQSLIISAVSLLVIDMQAEGNMIMPLYALTVVAILCNVAWFLRLMLKRH